MTYGYIYKTTNLVNGRFYIGQRKGQFQPKYKGSGIAIRRAIKQYRSTSFLVECLVTGASRFDLDWLEKHFISEYREAGNRKKLYNISDGGTGGRNKGFIPWNKGRTNLWKHTDEAKRRIGEAGKGRRLSEQVKRKMSLAQKRVPKSEEHKQALKDNHADFTGSNHPQWNPTAKYHQGNVYSCRDCSALITRRAVRCITCRNREINRRRYAA